jgi:hypothetical protein
MTRSATAFRPLGMIALMAGLAGCGSAAFPRELFTIEAQHADYPFMLSQAPSKRPGRPIHAESGTHAAVSQSTYSMGNTTVTVEHRESGQSELSAATKLAAQVRRADRWVQFEKGVFAATDFSTYGSSAADRVLSIEASAHR